MDRADDPIAWLIRRLRETRSALPDAQICEIEREMRADFDGRGLNVGKAMHGT